jgi:hypothetical protein
VVYAGTSIDEDLWFRFYAGTSFDEDLWFMRGQALMKICGLCGDKH